MKNPIVFQEEEEEEEKEGTCKWFYLKLDQELESPVFLLLSVITKYY